MTISSNQDSIQYIGQTEGVAVLIPHEEKFKLRSDSIEARGGGSFDPS